MWECSNNTKLCSYMATTIYIQCMLAPMSVDKEGGGRKDGV